MADIKSGIFAKNVQKRINRAQEKVLQKLGKADETKDEQFEQVVINFRRQESEGSRLQREMKAYMAAIKGMQQASINLSQSLHEVYEPDWHGKDDVMTIGKDCDALWEDFHNKVVDSTLLSLDEYQLNFPDLKNRVAKRSRKLIDYDSARHHVETLQASGMKNDRKMMKAEEELKQAQKVFDEFNVSLQDELPTLWDSRIDFYITVFKSVTSQEARFHRDISLICKQLYEVMTKLSEQHSDKMFTIQGAPSDSGPLRLARTPSPPEDETPPESPEVSSNHMLRPASPGPPRPKSPSQGPPVPPPPKATPTKEVAEEQIIDLFGGEFFPAPSPSQPNERPGESLLDLDFDAFQPDESVSPIPQTAVPWDMWSTSSQPAQSATDTGFVADWSADFGSMAVDGDAAAAAAAAAAGGTAAAGPEEVQGGEQDGGHGWPPAGDPAALPQTQATEPPQAAAGDEVTNTLQESPQDADASSFFADFDKVDEPAEASPPSQQQQQQEVDEVEETSSEISAGETEEPTAQPATEEADEPTEMWDQCEEEPQPPSVVETDTTESSDSAKDEKLSEKMPIPSVVIEPASSNEGDDDRDADIISPTAISDNGVPTESQTIKHMGASGGASGLPNDYLYKVETMHDFEAANSDELELKRGDMVLVVPTASAEDQDAGWLTGMKESDWLTLGLGAQTGLFPENFTHRVE